MRCGKKQGKATLMPYILLKEFYFLTKLQFLISTFSQAEEPNIIFSDFSDSNGKLRAPADLSSPGSGSKPEPQVTNAGHLQLIEFRNETISEIHSMGTALDSNQGSVSGYSLG
jgi:hypothetical protein